ncbi:MAG: hypothetical protein WCQ80_02740 [Bacilli bacterium]
MCQKEINRLFSNLFHVFNCDGCPYYYQDDRVLIGNVSIFSYHLQEGCHRDKPPESIYWFHQKLHRLLYDCCWLSKNSLFLWLEDMHFLEEIDVILELCMMMSNHIHIICD